MKFSNHSVVTLQILLKIIIVNIIVLLSLVSVHEFGHLVMGLLTGCSSARIVLFDTSREGPYTELFCNSSNPITYSGGILFSLAFSSLFLFLKEAEDKKLFFVAVGLSLMLSGLDIIALTSTYFSFYITTIFGFCLTIFGEYNITLSYAKKEELLKYYL
ncbi:MAG: M50 family metallopeptidase [Candidatus Aenigmatarchaeota archaeon]